MKRLRLLLLAPRALTVAGAAQAQMQGPAQINPGGHRRRREGRAGANFRLAGL